MVRLDAGLLLLALGAAGCALVYAEADPGKLTGIACVSPGEYDGGVTISECTEEEAAKCSLGCVVATRGNVSTSGCCDP